MTSLLFNADEITQRNKGLTFDDVLLAPRHCQITSRRGPNLETQLTKNFRLSLPIVAANMDTITEKEMVCAMGELGGLGILHRFMTVEEQVQQVKEIFEYKRQKNLSFPVAASIGVKEEGMHRAQRLVEVGVQILTIDIAHGDSQLMFETLDYLKSHFPHIDIIAGNVATSWGAQGLIDHGADAIKVGIGPGSMCTTRIITGHGVPQLSAIAMCVQVADRHNIPVMADGGIRTSGDMVKALSAGAKSVMVGSMLSGCLETPGEMISGKKKYRGMASKEAQISWRGELPQGMAAEGESVLVSCKGSVVDLIHEMAGGIRSGMTYMNAGQICEMRQNALFMEMSAAGVQESRAHGVHE